jgi:hypothetical protein
MVPLRHLPGAEETTMSMADRDGKIWMDGKLIDGATPRFTC